MKICLSVIAATDSYKKEEVESLFRENLPAEHEERK